MMALIEIPSPEQSITVNEQSKGSSQLRLQGSPLTMPKMNLSSLKLEIPLNHTINALRLSLRIWQAID